MPKTHDEIDWDGNSNEAIEDRIRFRDKLPDDFVITEDWLRKRIQLEEDNAQVCHSIYSSTRNGKKIMSMHQSDCEFLLVRTMKI